MGKSLRQRMFEGKKSWELAGAPTDEELPQFLARLSVDLAKGYPYSRVNILLSSVAMEGEAWQPAEERHLVYGKLSGKRLSERKKDPYVRVINLMCKHQDTGEAAYLILH